MSNNIAQLLDRCRNIEGLTLAQLANALGVHIPNNPLQRKGWAGMAVELALGATAGNKAAPDFIDLNVELKTLPIDSSGKPAESTFVTSIPLLTIHQETWQTSTCYAKLKQVLWIPIEADKSLPFNCRRIGQAILWSPSIQEEAILATDWLELTTMISTGMLHEISAHIGQYLQVRPKAASSKSLCYGYSATGDKILTLPRGFYLRSKFTNTIIRTIL